MEKNLEHPAITKTIRTGYLHEDYDEQEDYGLCPLCQAPLGKLWGKDDEGIVCVDCLTEKIWRNMPDSDKFEALGFKVRRAEL